MGLELKRDWAEDMKFAGSFHLHLDYYQKQRDEMKHREIGGTECQIVIRMEAVAI